MEYKSAIWVENFPFFMIDENRNELENLLKEHHIELIFIEKRSGAIASIFQAIPIFINEHLIELIIAGLLFPATYDAIKFTILRLVKGIRQGFFLASSGEKIDSSAKLKMNVGSAEILAPIPSDLTDEQFAKYMDMLPKALAELKRNQIPKIEMYECFIIEYRPDNEELRTITMKQYASERHKEQQARTKTTD